MGNQPWANLGSDDGFKTKMRSSFMYSGQRLRKMSRSNNDMLKESPEIPDLIVIEEDPLCQSELLDNDYGDNESLLSDNSPTFKFQKRAPSKKFTRQTELYNLDKSRAYLIENFQSHSSQWIEALKDKFR